MALFWPDFLRHNIKTCRRLSTTYYLYESSCKTRLWDVLRLTDRENFKFTDGLVFSKEWNEISAFLLSKLQLENLVSSKPTKCVLGQYRWLRVPTGWATERNFKIIYWMGRLKVNFQQLIAICACILGFSFSIRSKPFLAL